MRHYRLEGKTPVLENDLAQWAQWYATADLILARTILPHDFEIITSFVAIDYPRLAYMSEPELFATTSVWPKTNPMPHLWASYVTWDEAIEGHEALAWMQHDYFEKAKESDLKIFYPSNDQTGSPARLASYAYTVYSQTLSRSAVVPWAKLPIEERRAWWAVIRVVEHYESRRPMALKGPF